MAIVHDTTTLGTQFRDNSTYGHANPNVLAFSPSGTIRLLVARVTQVAISANDCMTSLVYGGVPMIRVPTNGFARDTATELGAAYMYYLGSGIPTGAQNLVTTYDDAEESMKRIVLTGYTAAGDCELVASAMVQENAANPQASLDSGTRTAVRLGVGYSGQDAIANITDLSSLTRDLGEKLSEGNYCRWYGRQTTPGSGAFSIGVTATSDDAAFCFAAFAEKVVSKGPAIMGGGFFDQRDSGLVTPRVWLPGESRVPMHV